MPKCKMTFLGMLFYFTYSVSPAQELAVKLLEELIIGDDEHKPKEYLFSGPEHISTDSHNNIYVADRNSAKIRVFDENGKFIRYIGQRGQGPGEILEVTSMLVTPEDEMLVADRMNRRITRFSLSGEFLTSYLMPEEQPVAPWQIRPLGNEAYACKYISRNPKSSYWENTTEYVHIFNKDFSTLQASLAKNTEIWDFSELFQRVASDRPFSVRIETIDADRILVVPRVYQGVIFLYQRKGNQWLLRKLQGKKTKSKAYKVLDKFPKSREERPAHSWLMSSGKYGLVGAIVYNSSKGIWALNDRNILHFSFLPGGKNKWYLGAEIFDIDGKYLGYGRVEDFLLNNGKTDWNILILWKDKLESFYLADYRSGFPVIRRMRLEYKIQNP